MRIASLTANPPLSEIGYLLHFNMWVESFEDSVIIEVSLLMWTVKITIAVNEDCFAHRKLARQCIVYCALFAWEDTCS
jgi:hypothetical protein